MFTKTRWMAVVLIGLFVFAPRAIHAENKKAPAKKPIPKKKKAESSLTLERLFPEKGLFGTAAGSMSFSVDGRYGAYLFRPYAERRHGSDLWIYDFNSGKSQRITSVSVMAAFQQATREVQADRVKRAKAAVAKDKSKGKKPTKKNAKSKKKDADLLTEQQRAGDWVDAQDADAKTAPRYSGVSSIIWSPVGAELLFTSRGDIYRYKMGAKAPERLTKTTTRESSARFLPDGKGFTYLANDALMEVQFDSSLVEQLDPALPTDEKMTSYRLSPDGKKLVIVTRKGEDSKSSAKKVSIVSYRDRFAKVREVPRQTADDKMPDQTVSVYLYDLADHLHEKNKLVRIYSRKMTGPRDVVGTPSWSLDSKRVVFAVFDQQSSRIQVYETPFAAPPSPKPADKKEASPEKKAETKSTTDKKENGKESERPKKPSRVIDRLAKQVHQELHTGGPNTPRMVQPMFLADNRRIVLLSELSGFRHLHVLDPVYGTLNPLTQGRFEVYPERISKDHRTLFVTTTKDHPARRHVYRVTLDSGAMVRLAPQDGTYSSVAVSNDGKHVLANFVRYGKVKELFAIDVPGKQMEQITHGQPDKAKLVTKVRPQFFTYQNRHGQDIHGALFKPDRWSAKDKRPLLIYVYGGPLGTRKMVADGSYSSDSFLFAWYMAKRHGYVTCTIDPRGVSGYGGLFENANYEHVGRPQVEDLVDGVKYLVKNYGVDAKRVGIHGWSFGGFQTQMCMYTKPDVFAVGIAGAGPTEWENYNSWYTTGTIGSSRVGVTDLKKYSLLPLAKNLKGKLLLLHGMEDSNVLYQDTVRVYRELLKAHKETLVELFLDPTGRHGLGGDVKTLARFRKYEEFLTRNLGEGKATGK